MTEGDVKVIFAAFLFMLGMMMLVFYEWQYYILLLGDITFMALIMLSVSGTVVLVVLLFGSLYYKLAMKQAQLELERARVERELSDIHLQRMEALSKGQLAIPLAPGHSLFTNQSLAALHAPCLPSQPMAALPMPMPIDDDQILPLAKWWSMANELHTMVVGESNSGKSYTSKCLLAYRFSQGGKGIIIDPHYEKGDWWGLPVIGAKRNFKAIDETFLAVLADVDKRFELRSNLAGHKFEEVTVLVDEVPAINSNCKHWDKFVSTMSSEARKVNYKLVVLSQSRLVEAFGLKGKSDMRENFSELLLGDFAVKAVKSDKAMGPLLASLERGGVLDCRGLNVIDLSGISQFLGVELQTTCIHNLGFGSQNVGTTGQSGTTDKPHEKWDLILDLLRAGLSGNEVHEKVKGNRTEILKVIKQARLQLDHEQSGMVNGHCKVVAA